MSRSTGEASDDTPSRRIWLRFRIGYLVILAAMGLFTLKFGQEAWADHQKTAQVESASAVVRAEVLSIKDLHADVKKARTPVFIRDQARRWGYVARGDGLVSINYQHPRPVHHVQRHRPKPKAQPVWQQWWNAFTAH